MKASDVLRRMEERGENRLMLLYRDENGKMHSLCYQDMMFFQCVGHNRYKMLGNPFELLAVVEGLKNGRYRLIGKGYYNRSIKFKK